ncbi:MAG: acyl-CoA dehydrogenase family protein, partial [Chloroflexi bacterium]|nr:acyl-CoA dehydrogenase family protein [Chloroflexota bacterium]
MDFDFSPELKQHLRDVREFLRAEIIPLERDFLARPFREILPTLTAKRKKVQAWGWWAPPVPRAYGGAGMSLADFAPVSEELGRTPLGHFVFGCNAPDIGNIEVMIQHATPEQKEKFLLPLARGEIRSCFSMTEPDFPGSNPVWMATTARKEGNDYVINGRKWFTSSADGAAFAIVMAITNPDAPHAHHRASQIIVP